MLTRPTRSRAKILNKTGLAPVTRGFKADIPADPYQKRAVFAPAEKTGGFVKCGNGFVRGKARIG